MAILSQATASSLAVTFETFPWTLAHQTAMGEEGIIRWSHGMIPFLGGRSTVWSAWCPEPSRDEMMGWPEQTIEAATKQMKGACKLLNVQSLSEIDKDRSVEHLSLCSKISRPIYSTLQGSAAHLASDYNLNSSRLSCQAESSAKIDLAS